MARSGMFVKPTQVLPSTDLKPKLGFGERYGAAPVSHRTVGLTIGEHTVQFT